MNYVQIEGFCALAQRLNFTKAAADIYTTQPSLSRNLVQLEQELGFQLFHRSKRSVTLTELGEQFLPYAEKIRKAHEEAASFAAGVVEDSKSPMIKEVRIGVATIQFTDFLPAMVSHMKAEMPEVHLLVTDGFQTYVLQQLKEDKLDVILTEGHSLENQEGVDTRLLRRSNVKLVVPATHPLAQKKEPVSLKKLREFNLPLLSADVTLTGLIKRMVDEGVDIRYFQSTTMTVSLVEAGFGIAICREELQRFFPPDVEVVYLGNL